MMRPLVRSTTLVAACLLIMAACGERGTSQRPVLRLAVTTSTRDSGLMDLLVPRFEAAHQVRVDVIASGTGKALKLGAHGDVDIVLVHDRDAELRFMEAGHGVRHEPIMHNRFQLIGPADDPVDVGGLSAAEALKRIAETGARFVSRGDDSGTHRKELQLWSVAYPNGNPGWERYLESGQGMGSTLTMASQLQAYTLSDHGTWLAFKDRIDLVPQDLVGDAMINPYGVIAVNPEKSEQIRHALAVAFIDFLLSAEIQDVIGAYRIAGEPLFKPDRAATRSGDRSRTAEPATAWN
ncbi:MAG: tungsten ABC transporter substrate-binding protein [Phycisphaeraceae bacterium]|nr:tungsten ABC transporter substrate-binding protein [Phycisphaeraceae bacterium]